MIGAAIAGVVGAVGSAYMKHKGAGKAAAANERGQNLLSSEFKKTEEEMAPWRNVGANALDRMSISLGLPDQYGRTEDGRDFSEFFKSPGYQFRVDEGQKAIERSAAARGSLQSGATMKALQRHGQGEASAEYSNYMSQLSGLSGQGLNAATNLGGMRGDTATNRASLISGAGLARQSGYNALGEGITGVTDAIGSYGGWKSGGGALA